MRLLRQLLYAASSRRNMSVSTPNTQPVFSQGEDADALRQQLAPLIENRWVLSSNGMGIERPFKFKTFKAAWKFMDDAAAHCRTERHHPEWSNVYNQCFVRWTTHNPPGLSHADLKLAAICDRLAARDESREIVDDPAEHEEGSNTLSGLADHAASLSPNCCAPRQENGRGGGNDAEGRHQRGGADA